MAEAMGRHGAERMKFFTDAVVAIAMTLLILPLLESVSDAAREGLDTAQFLDDHGGQIFAFVLSFLIIARFWVSHERLFDPVEQWSGWLMVLNILWMLTVVTLPVVTSMVGSMDTDRLQIALYIGTMLLNSLVMTAMSLVVVRTPVILGEGARPDTDALAGALGVASMLLLALVLALALPRVGYLALLVLFLADPIQARLNKRWRAVSP
jgi:TMEM175 potassium channel family protein